MEPGYQIVEEVLSQLLKRKSAILFFLEELSIFIFHAISGIIL